MVEGEDCIYYLSVSPTDNRGTLEPLAPDSRTSSDTLPSPPPSFVITARTPRDIALFPCANADKYPDGIQLLERDVIRPGDDAQSGGAVHFYELCSPAGGSTRSPDSSTPIESLIVEIEQCYGESTLRACASDNKVRCIVYGV